MNSNILSHQYFHRVVVSSILSVFFYLLCGSSQLVAAPPETKSSPGGGGSAGSSGTGAGGFAGIAWKTDFTAVKRHLQNLVRSSDAQEKVEILSEERNRYILVRRNDVLYRYSFYKTPLNVERINNHKLSNEEHDLKEARFFHVKVTMPLIAAAMIKEKMSKLFGRNTRSTVNKKTHEGADIWELKGGLIFQWHEPYRKMPFTRNIDYLSTEMALLIMKEFEQYFDARERAILKKVQLQ